jgi:hypothetical protein
MSRGGTDSLYRPTPNTGGRKLAHRLATASLPTWENIQILGERAETPKDALSESGYPEGYPRELQIL